MNSRMRHRNSNLPYKIFKEMEEFIMGNSYVANSQICIFKIASVKALERSTKYVSFQS